MDVRLLQKNSDVYSAKFFRILNRMNRNPELRTQNLEILRNLNRLKPGAFSRAAYSYITAKGIGVSEKNDPVIQILVLAARNHCIMALVEERISKGEGYQNRQLKDEELEYARLLLNTPVEEFVFEKNMMNDYQNILNYAIDIVDGSVNSIEDRRQISQKNNTSGDTPFILLRYKFDDNNSKTDKYINNIVIPKEENIEEREGQRSEMVELAIDNNVYTSVKFTIDPDEEDVNVSIKQPENNHSNKINNNGTE